MKRIMVLLGFVAVLITACTQEKTVSTVQEYLKKIQGNTSRNGFPFEVVHNQFLPKLSGGGEYFAFEKSLINNEAYFYEGYKKQVKVCNINNQQITRTLNFSGLESYPFMRYEVLGDNFSVWALDSSIIHIYDNNNTLQQVINIPLVYQNKQYAISTGPRRLMEYFPNQSILIIPISCMSEYDESETRNLPQFVAYNVNNGNVDFLPIYLPANYPVDKYLGELSFPMTAKYGNAFYALFPLSNVVYKYDVNTQETKQINLQLPVPLTSPASLSEPTDYTQFYEVMYRSNHIEGFAVVNDLIFLQQVDVFDENLASKKLVDHSVLYAFNNQGQIVWSGAFPEDIFGGDQTMFKLVFANDGKLNFIASNRNHENKLIQLSPNL